MAEKPKTKNNKELKKILIVIGVVIIAAAFFLFISKSKTTDSMPDNGVVISEVPMSDEEKLTSKTWTWVNSTYNDGSSSVPSTEGSFTADFLAENRFSAGTDCNTGNTTYELGEDNMLTINGPFASTLMFCEGSNEAEYFQQLQEVQSYMIDEEGNLILMFKFDSGSMVFE